MGLFSMLAKSRRAQSSICMSYMEGIVSTVVSVDRGAAAHRKVKELL